MKWQFGSRIVAMIYLAEENNSFHNGPGSCSRNDFWLASRKVTAGEYRPCVMPQCLPTGCVIIQAAPLRFFLPFDHQLQHNSIIRRSRGHTGSGFGLLTFHRVEHWVESPQP